MIKILDTLYRDRTYARFFVLETIARVPYFGTCIYLWFLFLIILARTFIRLLRASDYKTVRLWKSLEICAEEQ